jgi:hypothetical protein
MKPNGFLCSCVTFVQTPGINRRLSIAVIAITTAFATYLLIAYTERHDFIVASAIFLVSLLGFSTVAFLSFSCVVGWRVIDYVWVSASFVGVIVALVNVSEVNRRQELDGAKAQFRHSLSVLISTAQNVAQNYCTERPDEPLSALQRQVCERIPAFVPGMESIERTTDTGSDYEAVTRGAFPIGNVPADWWDMLLPPEEQSRPPTFTDRAIGPFCLERSITQMLASPATKLRQLATGKIEAT